MTEKNKDFEKEIFYIDEQADDTQPLKKEEENTFWSNMDKIITESTNESLEKTAEVKTYKQPVEEENQQPEYEILYKDNPQMTAEYQIAQPEQPAGDTVKVEKQGNKYMKNGKVVKRKRKDRLGFNWFFWISFVVLMIPVVWFGNYLLQAYLAGNKPVIGKRITDNVIYEAYQSDVEAIASSVNGLSGVESAECTLTVQTLRITVDANDSLTNEEFKTLAEKIYEIVDSKLPISKYFTRVDDYTQYDLEIKIYDSLEKEDTRIVILYKNANMEKSVFQDYTVAIDPELKAQIYEEQNLDENGKPLPEVEEEDESDTGNNGVGEE